MVIIYKFIEQCNKLTSLGTNYPLYLQLSEPSVEFHHIK